MQLAITDAKARLTDLIRRAEAVVLTRHGHAVARIVAIRERPDAESRSAIIAAARAGAADKV